jgi:hypothetical protein
MGLGLDLRTSRAKLAGAAEPLDVLARELAALQDASPPFTVVTDFDEATSWLSIKVRAQPVDLRLSVILGEAIHDLRRALDYVVGAS